MTLQQRMNTTFKICQQTTTRYKKKTPQNLHEFSMDSQTYILQDSIDHQEKKGDEYFSNG